MSPPFCRSLRGAPHRSNLVPSTPIAARLRRRPRNDNGNPMLGSTEKTKMLAGELYFANDPELVEERRRAQRLLALFNNSGSDETELRQRLLRELFGALGEGADIQP